MAAALPCSHPRASHQQQPGPSHQPSSSGRPRAPQRRPAPPAAPSELDTRLRRDTPFICSLRFKNDLPEIPCDPKMLVSQPVPEQLAKFSITSLEREARRELDLAPDLGIPISLLDLEPYSLPDAIPGVPPPALDPADAALLEDDGCLAIHGATPHSVRRFSARNAEVSWLMRTSYIAADSNQPRRQAKSAAETPPPEAAVGGRDPVVGKIAATFEAAARHPVHPSRRDVVALEVLPLLPDVERWGDKMVTVHFDADPQTESQLLGQVSDVGVRRQLAERCMLKSYRVNEKASDETAMALLVPEEALAEARAGNGVDAAEAPESLQGSYLWDSEYKPDLDTSEEALADLYLLTSYPDRIAYCAFDGRLRLRKRKRDDKDDPPPAKAVLTNRECSEAEVKERLDRQMMVGLVEAPAPRRTR